MPGIERADEGWQRPVPEPGQPLAPCPESAPAPSDITEGPRLSQPGARIRAPANQGVSFMKASISHHHLALCAADSLSLQGCSHARSEPGAVPPPVAPPRPAVAAPQPADAVLQYRADLALSDKQAAQVRGA